jgi:two-component system cell cycle sensor histidine kinase/response regulator CckA
MGTQTSDSPLLDANRVLLVGFELPMLERMTAACRAAGVDWLFAPTSESGLLEIEADRSYDAVVIDLSQSGANVLEVAQRFQLCQILHVTTVLILPPGSRGVPGLDQWADAILTAPVEPQTVVQTLSAVIDRVGKHDRYVLQGHRKPEHIRQRLAMFQAVRILTADLAKELDFDRFVRRMLEVCCQYLHAQSGVLWVVDPRAPALVRVSEYGAPLVGGLPDRIPLPGGNLDAMSPSVLLVLSQLGALVDFVQPLVGRGRVLGILGVSGLQDSTDPSRIGERELLGEYAQMGGILLENAALYSAAVRHKEDLMGLLSNLRVVLACKHRDDLLARLVEVAVGISGCPNVHVLLLDDASGHLRVMAKEGVASVELGESFPVMGCLAGLAIQRGEVVASQACQADPDNPRRVLDAAHGIQSLVCLPIRVPERNVGVLVLGSEQANAFPEGSLDALGTVVDLVSVVIERSDLLASLQEAYQTRERYRKELIHAEKTRALGTLAAGMAHDLNNTLAVTSSNLESILESRRLDDGTQAVLRDALRAAHDATEVVRRVQAFARAGKEKPELGRCNLSDLVEATLSLTKTHWHDRPRRENRPILVVRQIGTLPPVRGNQAYIREALANLIMNAVEAMPNGGTITFDGAERTDEAGQRWIDLRVADTGVGIPEALLSQVFDPFFTTKSAQGGSGLGLSVVQGHMQAMHGLVRVESEPAKGTVFTLRFLAETCPVDGAPMLKSRPVSTYRVLVVDDDHRFRRVIRTYLQPIGHTVVEAESVEEGLRLIRQHPIDLVISDIVMPAGSKDGFGLVEDLRNSGLPIILITGFDPEERMAQKTDGVADVLHKPIRREDLLRTIQQIMTAAGSPSRQSVHPTPTEEGAQS